MDVITVSKLGGEMNMKVFFPFFYHHIAMYRVCEAKYYCTVGNWEELSRYMVVITATKPGM